MGSRRLGLGFISNWRNQRIVCTCWRIPSENNHSLLLGVISKRTTIVGRREGIRENIQPMSSLREGQLEAFEWTHIPRSSVYPHHVRLKASRDPPSNHLVRTLSGHHCVSGMDSRKPCTLACTPCLKIIQFIADSGLEVIHTVGMYRCVVQKVCILDLWPSMYLLNRSIEQDVSFANDS